MDRAKPIAFLPLSSLPRLPNYCLTNLCTCMLISRFLACFLSVYFSPLLSKKGAFNNWINYIDFVPPRLFPSLSLSLVNTERNGTERMEI